MKKTILFLFFICGIQCLFAQSINSTLITLVEESTTGKYKDTIPYDGAAIVDINSRILVKVNIAELEDQMFRFQGIAAKDERLKKLRKLNNLMRNQNEILSLLNDKFSADNKLSAKLTDYQQLATLVDDLLDEIEADDDLYNIIDNPETDRRYNREGGTFALLVFDILGEQAQALREDLLQELAVDGSIDSALVVNFRLGAFIKNKSGGRPVHIENFDDLTSDEYIEISRFGAPLSEEEEEALFRNKDLRDSLELNMNSLTGNMKSTIKAKMNNLFPSDSSKIKLREVYQTSLSLLTRDTETRPAAQVLLENELNLERVNRLYSFATENFESFVGVFPKKLLEGDSYYQSFERFGSLVQNAYDAFHSDVNAYGSSNSFGSNIPGLDQLNLVDNTYNAYNNGVQRDILGIQQLVQEIGRLLNPFRKSYVENEEFTEAVRRFTVGKIPSDGYIELKGIGERRAGDEILLRALIERGQDKANPNYEYREIYRRYLYMARINPHLKMSGSLVLADPLNQTNIASPVRLENQFQFAPNYGIFMKWGSRKSKFYNDFLSFGVGLGFSSPDFNLDGTPEFGAGVIVTGFRDILSVGWSWNFGVDVPYTSIGFNIPFTVGGLPGVGAATGFVPE
ncbi:MAG: hypothetical protein AAF599_00885 [Bacteroidota bacterium]